MYTCKPKITLFFQIFSRFEKDIKNNLKKGLKYKEIEINFMYIS